jgi:hypothetical protein
MPLVGFEPTILVSERPQTHALDRTVTGIGDVKIIGTTKSSLFEFVLVINKSVISLIL